MVNISETLKALQEQNRLDRIKADKAPVTLGGLVKKYNHLFAISRNDVADNIYHEVVKDLEKLQKQKYKRKQKTK